MAEPALGRRARHVRRASIAAVLLAALPALAPAQIGSTRSSDVDGWEQGVQDGRIEGGHEGAALGRSQAQLEAWLQGFAAGVREPPDAWTVEAAERAGADAGRRTGALAGEVVGRTDGIAAARAAWAELRGEPARREAPDAPEPDPPHAPHHPSCEEPAPVRLQLSGGIVVEVSPARADRDPPPLDLGLPDPPLPSATDLRVLGHRAGWAGDELETWVRRYREGWRQAFRDAFRRERDAVPWAQRSRWRSDGEVEGRREADRRAACAGHARAHADAFRDEHATARARAWSLAWDEEAARHRGGAVVIVESARLEDGGDDGVLEPGEPLALAASLANAGLQDVRGDVATWSGVLSIVDDGRVDGGLPAQSRRQVTIDGLAVEAGAPLGASVVLEIRPAGGEPLSVSAIVGRPVVIDAAEAWLDVRDGSLVTVVRPAVRSVATRDTDRGLVVVSGDVAADLGVVAAGARPEVALVLPAAPSALARGVEGEVALRSGRERWMSLAWSARAPMERAVELATRLPAGSDRREAALALRARLEDELGAALADPKLYRRLEERSDLAAFGAARRGLAAADRAELDAAVSAPLLARVEQKSTPRRVRRAVRNALEAP